MNEYEATFSQDGRYITERRWPSPEHTYEIVNAVPLGYTVWNIGHPVAGEYLPLCRLSQHQPFPGGQSIDVDSLKAIRCDGAQTILDAVGYGPGTLEEMERFVEKNKNEGGSAVYAFASMEVRNCKSRSETSHPKRLLRMARMQTSF